MRRAMGWILVLAGGCGGHGSDGGSDGGSDPDAGSPDADVPYLCSPLAEGGSHVVYLDFDGVTLAPGDDDPAENQIACLNQDPSVVPRFADGAPLRESEIKTIACAIRGALDDFDVAVVTDRPASGTYDMLAFGGAGSDVGYQANLGVVGCEDFDCANAHAGVGWVAELDDPAGTKRPDALVANVALALIGESIGLDETNTTHDCLNPGNADASQVCSYQDGAMKITDFCPTGSVTQDEHAAMLAAFGPRP